MRWSPSIADLVNKSVVLNPDEDPDTAGDTNIGLDIMSCRVPWPWSSSSKADV